MHQHSKNHKIRGYSKGNSHVLEIVEKVVFLAEKAMISDFFRETLYADTELLSPSL